MSSHLIFFFTKCLTLSKFYIPLHFLCVLIKLLPSILFFPCFPKSCLSLNIFPFPDPPKLKLPQNIFPFPVFPMVYLPFPSHFHLPPLSQNIINPYTYCIIPINILLHHFLFICTSSPSSPMDYSLSSLPWWLFTYSINSLYIVCPQILPQSPLHCASVFVFNSAQLDHFLNC